MRDEWDEIWGGENMIEVLGPLVYVELSMRDGLNVGMESIKFVSWAKSIIFEFFLVIDSLESIIKMTE